MTQSGTQQISVIVPCHNDGAYLAEALDSVLSQIRKSDDVIVVNDGSSDSTDEVARQFAKHLCYIQQPHRGIGGARNTGLSRARGHYIAFLDADDLWPAGSLESRIGQLDAVPDLDAIFGLTEEFLSPEFQAAALSKRVARGPFPARLAGAMVVKRHAFERIGGFNEELVVGEWIDWINRFSHAGLQIASLPRPALRRRIHAGNASEAPSALCVEYLAVLRAGLKRKASGPESFS